MNVLEAEKTIKGLTTKVSMSEKTKARLETDLEEMELEYDRTHAAAAAVIINKRSMNLTRLLENGR